MGRYLSPLDTNSSELCDIKCKWLGQVLVLMFFPSALQVARSALLY